MSYYTALDDVLLQELHSFKHSKQFSNKTIEAFFHFYKPPHITNVAQLQRVGINDQVLMASLAQQSWANDDLPKLCENTIYKLVLGTTINTFPYVNVFDDKFENNYTSTFYKGENRDKVKEHIKSLLSDAENVFIYDRYFKSNWNRTKKFFLDLVPHKTITFFYKDNHFNQSMISEVKNIFSWNFRSDRTHNKHGNLHDTSPCPAIAKSKPSSPLATKLKAWGVVI